MQDHVVFLLLIWARGLGWGGLHTVFHIGVAIYIPPNSVLGCPFLHTFAIITLVISRLFDNSHSDGCEVITHCGFDLHFPDD